MLRSIILIFVLISSTYSAPPGFFEWAELQPPLLQKDPLLSSRLNITSELIEVVSAAWTFFKHTFKREFMNVLDEGERFFIFAKNFIRIHKHNTEYRQGKRSYEMGVNRFTDLSHSEIRSMLGYRYSLKSRLLGSSGSYYLSPRLPVELPESVDWRSAGAVTPIKDQGRCGSCWAFSSTGALEGQHFRKTGILAGLSEQQLVDCSSAYGNMGCQGGLMDKAFQYVKDNNGIDDEKSYPYESGKTGEASDVCKFEEQFVAAKVTGFVDLPSKDERKLKEAVANVGPISIAINSGLLSFPHYKHGIYDDPDCQGDPTDLDHGVLLVGYGSENGTDYWLIKNSWGTSWGEDGFVRIRRDHRNLCGVTTAPSYPLV